MDYGLVIFPTEYAPTPAELALAAEERGFESLWFPEHTHIPASRKSPWPGGAELPQAYYDTYDLFVALTNAASVTSKIKVGSGICLMVERDPITTAKEVASLDRLSNGRFLFGIGGGWNEEEMANHGTQFKRRWQVMRERVEAMKEIWANEQAEYHGEFVDFDPIFSNPKPVQKPHPPVIIGGSAPHALRRAVRYCDGWIPIGVRDDIVAQIPELRRMEEEAGRGPGSVEVSVFYAMPDAETVANYQELGVKRCIFGLPSAGAQKVLPMMDTFAEFARKQG